MSAVVAAPEAAKAEPEVAAGTHGAAGLAPEYGGAAHGATGTASLDWNASGWDTPGWDALGPDDAEALEAPVDAAQASTSGHHPAPTWEPPILQAVSGTPAADAAAAGDVDTHAVNGAADRAAARISSPVAWPADQARPGAAPVAWPVDQARPGASPVAWPADQAKPDPSPEVARAAVPIRSIPDAPGAYVPPIMPAEPAGAPAPARAWAGQPAVDGAASKTDALRSSIAGDLLDAARVTEFVGWLAVAGSAMAAVGFLLPWGVSVIGASGVGYFDRWGLAGPFHPIVFLSLLALLGLSLARNPIPLWLRVGVLGLGLGALLLGLTWPYVLGLTGTGPGAMVVAIGALVLVAAGIGALASDRHAYEDRGV